MPAANPTNVTTWRSSKPYSSHGFLFILKPEIVFQARINMASVTYPLTSLSFDTVTTGAYTDIKPGQTMWLGDSAGAYLQGRTRVRAAASVSAIPIARTPRGQRMGELNVVDNQYITVVNLREVWAKVPFIDDSGISKKDETSFAANIAQPPIANGGPGVPGFVDPDTGILTLDFTGLLSQVVDPTASALTYSWDFQQGDTSTDDEPTGIEFEPGFYYVELTVNDGTRDHTTYIPVAALEKTGEFAPIPVESNPRSLKPDGQAASFTLKSTDLNRADYPPGTLVMYFEQERYGLVAPESLEGTAGREHVKFVGWLDDEPTTLEATENGLSRTVTLNALDVAQKLAKRPGFGQRVVNKASPTLWQHMKSANIDRYLHHLLHWHSTALEVAPFTWSGLGSVYPFHDLNSDGASLYAQVDQRAKAITARLTCNQRGELMVKIDPQRNLLVNRTNVVQVALTADDWKLVQYTSKEPSVHWVQGKAVTASATTQKGVFSIAPGTTPGQGDGSQDIGQQLVVNQAELDMRTGNDYARANASEDIFTIELTHGGDIGIDPAYMEWVTLGISAELAAQRGLTIDEDTRFLVLEVTITHDDRLMTNTVRLRLERETVGFPGVPNPPKVSTQTPPSIPNIPLGDVYGNLPEDPAITFPPIFWPVPTNPNIPPAPDMSGNLVLMAVSSSVQAARNFKGACDLFLDLAPPLAEGESVMQAIWSGFGPDVYVLVSDGTNSRVLYTSNGLATNIVWVAGESVGGIYTVIRPTSKQGEIYILCPGGDEDWCEEFDFTIDDGGFTPDTYGSYSAGIGWVETAAPLGAAINIERAFASAIITGIAVDLEFGVAGTGRNLYAEITPDEYIDVISLPPGPQTLSGSGSTTGTNIRVNPSTGGSIYDSITITKITICGIGLNPFGGSSGNIRTCFSTDFGETLEDAELIGVSYSPSVGIDTAKVGTAVLSAEAAQIQKAITGGAYAPYGSALSANGLCAAIVAPYFQLTSASAINNGTSPEFILGLSLPDDDTETLYRVTAGGNTLVAITPTQGSDPGAAVSPNCIIMPWRSGEIITCILNYAGTRRLKVSDDTGGSWTDRGALTADASYIRMRKGDVNLRELYIADGAPAYSPDFGVTIVPKTFPVDEPLVSIEPYG